MLKRITQSFQKDFRDYMAGRLCGNLVRERWVNDRMLSDPDEEPGAMELGSYFEYILSLLIFPEHPALPKDKKIPQPFYQESKVKANGGKTTGLKVDHMYQEYRNAHDNATIVSGYFKEMGLKVIATQQSYTKGNRSGTLDLICVCEKDIVFGGESLKAGEEIIIDLKYSGLFKDTTPAFNKHGWKWSDVQKEYHGTQAKQYFFIGGGRKFFFFVVNSANGEGDAKVFYIPIDQEMIDAHIAEGNDYLVKLKFYSETGGFEPRPALMTCKRCPLREECHDRKLFPTIETVEL